MLTLSCLGILILLKHATPCSLLSLSSCCCCCLLHVGGHYHHPAFLHCFLPAYTPPLLKSFLHYSVFLLYMQHITSHNLGEEEENLCADMPFGHLWGTPIGEHCCAMPYGWRGRRRRETLLLGHRGSLHVGGWGRPRLTLLVRHGNLGGTVCPLLGIPLSLYSHSCLPTFACTHKNK